MRICVFEDDQVGGLEPLAFTRPAFDLWCGASSLLERQCRYFAATEVTFLVRPLLADWCRLLHPGHPINAPHWWKSRPAVLVNARWLPPAGPARGGTEIPRAALIDDQVAYLVLRPPDGPDPSPGQLAGQIASWKRSLPHILAGGYMLNRPWDLVSHNAEALEQDFARLHAVAPQCGRRPGLVVIGESERVFVAPTARVEPLAVADTTNGPVIVDEGAVVRTFSRLEGPCYVGAGTQILGATLRGSTVGPRCRVGGEVEASIVQGYSNKAHDGFLGHSYVGEWVNLAAGTQVSDLRNDYRPVRVPSGGEDVDTGLVKVGAFLSDYTRTGVGALLDCGTTVGPFAHLLPWGTFLSRAVPPFCTFAAGRLRERTNFRGLFAAAAAAMQRRGSTWTEAHAEFFLSLYEATAAQRRGTIGRFERRSAVGGTPS